MAIVDRKRKKGVVYYVVLTWQGKPVWEKVGPNHREAETVERQRKREIEAGTFQPRAGSRATTFRQWFESWIVTRKVRSKDNEARWIRRHVLTRAWFSELHVGDVRPRHFDQLVRELKAEGKLKDKSIGNLRGVLHVIFKHAQIAELCGDNPIIIDRGVLNTKRTREPEIYSAPEVRVLTRHHIIAWPIRVLNAMTGLAGMREGEACGRRWRDLHTDAAPLWALHVHDQYDSQPLKTERPRMVPVHPELAAILEAWGREGFELLTGEKPRPDDFIVPNVGKRARKRNHTRSSYYKAFVRGARAAGVRPRTLHATRHTFITLARRGGAPKDVLERVTHNAAGDMVDRYTHWEWEPLCNAVLCLDLDAHLNLHPPPGNTGKSGRGPEWLGSPKSAKLLESDNTARGSIPRASTSERHDFRGAVDPRQSSRQSGLGNSRALRGPEALVATAEFERAEAAFEESLLDHPGPVKADSEPPPGGRRAG